ncbi:MAG: hypothetical protein K8R21_06595 [Leptospira sp.]|nr:hypothetical protein [Leptospira sp.]
MLKLINKSGYWKIRYYIIVTCFLISCAYQISNEKVTEITQNEHGTLQVYFPKVSESAEFGLSKAGTWGFGNDWSIGCFIDDDLFIRESYPEGSKLEIPLPVGEHTLLYRISLKMKKPLLGVWTFDSDTVGTPQKILRFKIEKNKITTISITQKKEMSLSVVTSLWTFILSPLLWPIGYWPYFQEEISLNITNR